MREEGDGDGGHDRDRGLGQAMGDRRGARRLARARARRHRTVAGAEGARRPYRTRPRLRCRPACAVARRARGISLGVRQGTADALPFEDCSFDFVLSWNVIHHGTLGDVGRRLAEIWRVLKPGALYQGTMLPTRNINYGRGRTVAPDTFIRDRAEEPGHPHFYCDAATLVALHAGFELLSLKQQLQRKPGSWHWHIIAERRPQ